MATLVLDIETVGTSWDAFDSLTQKTLTRWINKTSVNEVERRGRIETLKNELGLSPLTGEIVALGVYDIERELGAVYIQGEVGSETEFDGFAIKSCSEKEILEDFWESARSYDVFVTFSGRAFDLPFLLHRSVANGVMPSVEVMKKRYLVQQSAPYHIDLQEELTFYGAMQKRPSLHMFCQAYGIESSKINTDGEKITELFKEKKYKEIAEYNAGDVRAILALYHKWYQYLAPYSFKERLQ